MLRDDGGNIGDEGPHRRSNGSRFSVTVTVRYGCGRSTRYVRSSRCGGSGAGHRRNRVVQIQNHSSGGCRGAARGQPPKLGFVTPLRIPGYKTVQQ